MIILIFMFHKLLEPQERLSCNPLFYLRLSAKLSINDISVNFIKMSQNKIINHREHRGHREKFATEAQKRREIF